MGKGGRRAIVAGASGLVGGHLVRRLLADETWSAVTLLVRRELPLAHPKLTQRVVDFTDLPRLSAADDLFCALGTTIAKAGSREAFRAVDFDAVVGFAQAGLRAGAKQILLVSSLGADYAARTFYSRVKGETERAVATLPFDSVQIFRPSLLLGERSELRRGERLAAVLLKPLTWFAPGPLARLRPIAADTVAAAMVEVARTAGRSVAIYQSEGIRQVAEDGASGAGSGAGSPAS
jgi:uncharacterized protein YbjT (DUF2867 family)